MARYLKTETAIDFIERMKPYHQDADDIAEMLDNMPAEDVVPSSAYDQVAWERNLAEVQLKSIGKSLGEKMDDVQPVKHGQWIKARGSWCTPGGDPVWECSECGKGIHVYGVEHGTYGSDVADGQWVACPNCGAKMDGET